MAGEAADTFLAGWRYADSGVGFMGWSSTSSINDIVDQLLNQASQDRPVYLHLPTQEHYDSTLLQRCGEVASQTWQSGTAAAEALHTLRVYYCSKPSLHVAWRYAGINLLDEDVQSCLNPARTAVDQLRALVHSNPCGVLRQWIPPEPVTEEVAHDLGLAEEMREEGESSVVCFEGEYEALPDPLAAARSCAGCYIACSPETSGCDDAASRAVQLNFMVHNAFRYTHSDMVVAANHDANSNSMSVQRAVHAIQHLLSQLTTPDTAARDGCAAMLQNISEPHHADREVYIGRKHLAAGVTHWGVMIRDQGAESGLILELAGEGGSVPQMLGQAVGRDNLICPWPRNYVILYEGVIGQRSGTGGISADGEAAELGVGAGTTSMSNEAIIDWLKYYVEHSPHYSMVHNNCQHFVEAFCKHAIGPDFAAPIKDTHGGLVQTNLTSK